MEGACVYEEKMVIHELTQGIQMANQLRANLHSAEARDLLIQKILSSYDNALFVLKSRNPTPALPAASQPVSSISVGSPGSEGFVFEQPFTIQQGQNVTSKKRKASVLSEENEITHHNQHPSVPANPNVMLSNLRANLSVDTTVLDGETLASPFSLPSTSSGLMDDLDQFHFPNYCDDELWQVCLPSFISPATSETNLFGEWGSSSSLDLLACPPDVDSGFEFMNSLF